MDAIAHHPEEQLGSSYPGLKEIRVGAGVKPNDGISPLQQSRAQIGVEIQRDHNRYSARNGAQAGQQIPFRVFHALDEHGAVQRQEDPVRRQMSLNPREEVIA